MSRADLDTIRKAMEWHSFAYLGDCATRDQAVSGCDVCAALAALDRLAGCVLLEPEAIQQAETALHTWTYDGWGEGGAALVRALLDARLGAAAEETKP